MSKQKVAAVKDIYQIKISLVGIDPPIWRRVLAPNDTTLEELHWIIQIAMGWENSHLHQFKVDNRRYSDPEFELEGWPGHEVGDETQTNLSELRFKRTRKFYYEYDFGDSWNHEIKIEKVLARDVDTEYPVCVEGERACPPEDCGGVWGYQDLLDALNNPDDSENEERLDWLGEDFDPEEFDIEEVNEVLQR
jgi:hypothetical protein